MTPPFITRLCRVVASSLAAPRTAVATLATTLTLLCAAASPAQQAPRTTLITSTSAALVSAADSGPIPGSQRLSLTLTLAQDPARTSALQQFLSDVTTPSSPSYHHFLTPTQFAAVYGASSDQLAAATAWATAQGFTVDAVSPSATRLSVSAPASTVQNAFAVSLHTYQVSGALYFANATQPSLPASAAPLFAAIDGLSNLPTATLTANASPATLASLATVIDANATPILTLESSLTSTSLADSALTAWTTLLRQAGAQGITLLASRPSIAAPFPASLPEVTAVAVPGATADTTLPTLPRPSWQAAPGLPADALRYAPDLAASSLTALAQTLSSIEATSARQGNINAILYSLGPIPNLYTQPDSAPQGTWEPATGLGLVNLDVLAKAFPRGTTSVEVDTTASNYSPVHGAGFTLTSTVYPGVAGATPTGSITWTSSNTNFFTTMIPLNGNSAATSPTFQLPGGSYTITSTYSGDGTFAPGSTNTTVYVSAEPANFTIAVPQTATLGGTLAVTATVTSPSGIGIPSGTITAGVTGATSQTVYLNGSGSTSTAAFTFNVNQAGTLAVTAACTPGDGSFTCYNQQNATVNVAKANPTISLNLSTTAPTNGAAVTFTSAVTGLGTVTPTGTIAIKDNGNQIASITLPATTISAPLGAGTTHSVTAVYSGDNNYNTVTSAATSASSGVAATTITAPAFPTSFQYGQTTTLVVTVNPTSGQQVNGTAPTGNITVTPGTITSGTQLGGGTVNIMVSNLPVGADTLTVSYPGDANYGPSTLTVPVTVTPFAAAIVPQLSYNMFTQGSQQTLTVQFSSPINAPVPQNAAFTATLNGTVYPGKFNINGGGVNATGSVVIYAPAPAGTYNLTVACVANVDFTCNTPAPIAVTSTATTFMGPPPTGTGTSPTTTTLASTSLAGAGPTLTATVAGVVGATPITGTVVFYDGATQVASAPVALVGTAYVATATNVTLANATSHSLTAVYSGDTTYAPSTSAAISITSNASPAAITLTANTTMGEAGQSIALTARVTGSTFSGVVPTGSVTFFLGGTTPSALATIGLGFSGPGVATATYTTTGLPAGTQTVYAVYSGDGNFSAVTSNSITLGLSDFSVTFSPAVITLTSGQTGTTTASVNLVGAGSNTISLACTPPANTSIGCSFSPSTLSAGGATTLTVTTVAHKLQPTQSASLRTGVLAGVSFAALLCFFLPGRTRHRLPTLLLVLLACILTANLGCGSSDLTHPISGTGGTPLGTSILSITTAATNGTNTIRHNYTVQVTVQ